MYSLNVNLSVITLRRILAFLALVSLWILSAHPSAQWLIHTLLVHALALDPTSSLLATLWLTLSGWCVEVPLRTTPWVGALPFANLTVGLFFLFINRKYPPRTYAGNLLRFIGVYGIHLMWYLFFNWRLNHVWAWDDMYLNSFLASPFLAALSWQLIKLERRKKI